MVTGVGQTTCPPWNAAARRIDGAQATARRSPAGSAGSIRPSDFEPGDQLPGGDTRCILRSDDHRATDRPEVAHDKAIQPINRLSRIARKQVLTPEEQEQLSRGRRASGLWKNAPASADRKPETRNASSNRGLRGEASFRLGDQRHGSQVTGHIENRRGQIGDGVDRNQNADPLGWETHGHE